MTTRTRLRGGAEGNPPAVDVPGEGEEGSGTEEPGTGEEPGGEESGNLGTESVKVPGWAIGDYGFTFNMLGQDFPGTLSIDESGNFKVAVTGMGTLVDSSDPNCVTDIKYQNDDADNKVYTLTAIVNVALSTLSEEGRLPGDTEESSKYSTFTMKQVDNGIELTIDSDVPPISFVTEPLMCNKASVN